MQGATRSHMHSPPLLSSVRLPPRPAGRVLPIALAVLVTTVFNNLLWHCYSPAVSLDGQARTAALAADDSCQKGGWQMPEEWRAKVKAGP